LQVIINKLGVATDPEILRSSGNESLDSAAVNAAIMTEWIPAQIKGEPVSVKISIPIVFRLKTDDITKERAG
jgi:TonB family protein